MRMTMMRWTCLTIGLGAVAGLSACAVAPPVAPGVMALPAEGKSFAAFQQEDMSCRRYAYDQSGGAAGAQAATNSAVGTAVVGTAIGAGLGAALGSLSGQMGAGAAVGGTMGALIGGSSAASGAGASAAGLQQSYDMSYTQCMYSYGNSVQNPPGGYAAGPRAYPYPYYGYGPAAYVGPTVVIGGGWGWGGRGRYGYGRRW